MHIDSIRSSPDALKITWSDGRESRLDSLWLRDHCQMPDCRDPHSGQRFLNVTDIPQDVSITSARLAPGGDVEVNFAPQEHFSIFSQDWLRSNCYCLNEPDDDRRASDKYLWDKDSLADWLPQHEYDVLVSLDSQRKVLEDFSSYGFVVLSGVPCKPGTVLEVIRSFGFVRETNYGVLFEVRTKLVPENLAYSNLGLGTHTDNPYREPPPTIQVLHCLDNSVEGGDSILLDGFTAAAALSRESSEHFFTLARQPVEFRYTAADADLHARVPFIEVNERYEVRQVRFNNRSIATIRLPENEVRSFYAAYRHFAEIIERDELKVQLRLEPGMALMFDNTRVLHARTAFSREGTRYLQGAYADLDALYSRLRTLRRRKATEP